MKHAFLGSTLFLVLLFGTIVTGCHNDEPPFSPTAPSTTPPSIITEPDTSTYDEKLVGDWYHIGSDDGVEFDFGGTMLPLFVDLDNRLLRGPSQEYSWSTPQQRLLIISSYFNSGERGIWISRARFTYTLTGNDSILTLGSIDGSSGNSTTYSRAVLGQAVK